MAVSPPQPPSRSSGLPRAAPPQPEQSFSLFLERPHQHFRFSADFRSRRSAAALEPPQGPPRPHRRPRRPRPPPNPLFTRWLREWRDEAAGTPARATYERALRSLARYPLPLRSGRAAAILRHFGPKLCRRLELRMRRHRQEQGLPPSPPPEEEGLDLPLAPPTRRPAREYRPLPHSGAWAIILTLHKSQKPLPEAELLEQATPLCQRPWGSGPSPLSSLLRRDLLKRSGCPPRFSLTPQGELLAQRLAAATPEAPPPAPPGGEGKPPSPTPRPELEFELQPGQFDVILCADVTEANGGAALAPLRSRVPLLQLRRLHVGDFLWVARERDPPPGHAPRELVLDVVVERKTAADLGSSLSDGRYREQKFRLGRCGLRHPVFLLEEPGGGERLPLPLPVLRQAAASTQVLDGFFVKRTGGPQESAAYLGALGEQLRRLYEGRVLRAWGGDVRGRGPPEPPGSPCSLLPFPRLGEGGKKSQAQSVGQLFARQLLQLGGVSGGRAAAILHRYPTPTSLMAALSPLPAPPQRQALLSTIKCGPLQRNLGPALSRSLAQLYGTTGALR